MTDTVDNTEQISFTVYGTPIPQGSMRGFVHTSKATGKHRAILTADNRKTKPWRQDVAGMALEARSRQGFQIIKRPSAVLLQAMFYFKRPNGLKRSIQAKTTRPDLSKLVRAIEDSLTGILYEDDAQVIRHGVAKVFGEPERAEITVTQIE